MQPERRMVKKTVIPVTFIDDPTDIKGLVHFPTEHNPKVLQGATTSVTRRKFVINYKREVEEDEEEENQVSTRKREVEYLDVVVQPRNNKDKHFKIEVPTIRGFKSSKSFSRSSEVFFHFHFNNSEGKLTLLNGIQDAKMEILRTGRVLNSKQRVQIQLSMLDKRRRDPINESKYLREDSDSDSD